MKISEPLGNPAFAPLLVRLPLGFYLINAGRMKLDTSRFLVSPEFVRQMQATKAVPDQLATLYAILIPYLEIFTGALVLFGFWMTLAGIISSLIIASYLFLSGFYPADAKGLISRDVVMLGGALSLLYSGAGYMSIDRFRKGG